VLDDDLLYSYWASGCAEEQAGRVVELALYPLPSSAKLAARAAQVARRTQLAEAFAARIDGELLPHLDRLRLRLRQVDRIGDPNSEPQVLFAELAEEADDLTLTGFDVERLRNVRLGAGSRPLAARRFLDELGESALPPDLLTELETAIADVIAQIDRGELAQALLAGPDDEGFVIGLRLGSLDQGDNVTTEEDVAQNLLVSSRVALQEVVGVSAARFGMEWHLGFEGSSIGLPMALAGLVARNLLDPDPMTAATGQVVVGGAVVGVGGIEAKLRAAAASGIQRVILPDANRAEAEGLGLTQLDLRFVSEVSQLRQAAMVSSTSGELDAAGRLRVARQLLKSQGYPVIEEKVINHGHQLKVRSLAGDGVLSLYDSGSVVVGGKATIKAPLDAFADQYLREAAPENRDSLTLSLPPGEVTEQVFSALLATGAGAEEAREHEAWRLRLARGKSGANAVLYNSGKLVVQGTAPAHDLMRDALQAPLGGMAGSEVLSATPAAQRVRERRQASAQEPWIGTDESGKGDYFGPLVSAAAYVDPGMTSALEEIGVKDSKRLSDTRVFEMAPKLRNLLGNRARVTVIQPARFNSLREEMRGEGKNLNSLLAWGHYRSVLDLLQAGARPAYLIVDQFADASYIEERLAKEAQAHSIEILQFPKAEADIAVAAASVLAREAFLLWLQRESGKAGLTLPKGAGDQAVAAARELVAAQGRGALGNFAKLSFRTTEKVLAPDEPTA
jgi:ribonuclease HIII